MKSAPGFAGAWTEAPRLASKRLAMGAPPSISDMLAAQHHCGVNHLSMRVSWPGMASARSILAPAKIERRITNDETSCRPS